ncbi:MAG: alkaline phosphatase family protein [Patescibacteria group bacterium]
MKKVVILAVLALVAVFGYQKFTSPPAKQLKLYWFIPDGVRAEPTLFNIYKWAEEGKLPNIKKLMERGVYGYSYPNFPSHTPTNFATLLTGTYPEVNGVNDGPMRAIGKPLDKVAVGGFRSVAKKVPPIWKTLEEAGMKVAILSVPGSTPPEINKGVVLRGRWGGWGADFHAINFETKGNLSQRIKQGRAARLFYFGPPLAEYLDSVPAKDWVGVPPSYSPALEVSLKGWGSVVYGYIYDTTSDGKKNYDSIAFSKDKKIVFATLKQGQWSNWEPITLKWKAEDKEVPVETFVKAAG